MNAPIIPPDSDEPYDPYHRLVAAMIHGEIADAIYLARCQELGVTPEMRPPGASALEFIVTASACRRGPRQ